MSESQNLVCAQDLIGQRVEYEGEEDEETFKGAIKALVYNADNVRFMFLVLFDDGDFLTVEADNCKKIG